MIQVPIKGHTDETFKYTLGLPRELVYPAKQITPAAWQCLHGKNAKGPMVLEKRQKDLWY